MTNAEANLMRTMVQLMMQAHATILPMETTMRANLQAALAACEAEQAQYTTRDVSAIQTVLGG